MALSQMVNEKRIPFSVHIPNEDTIAAMNEDLSQSKRYHSVEKLMDDIWPDEV
jgi:antitoxin component of RelBE/YafQ-DinJ toxin-antitoxin module